MLDGSGGQRDAVSLLDAYLDWHEAVDKSSLLVPVKRGHIEKFRNEIAMLRLRLAEAEKCDQCGSDLFVRCLVCAGDEEPAAGVEGNGPACNPYEGMTAEEKADYLAAGGGK